MPDAKTSSNEIVLTRIYDAPSRLYGTRGSTLSRLQSGGSPRGFTITTYQKDVRVGGTWTYTMPGPDGTNYENKTLFHEVKSTSSWSTIASGNIGPPSSASRFDSGDVAKAKMEMYCMALETAEAAASTRKMIKAASGNSTWDRLGEYLATELIGKALHHQPQF